MGNLRFPRPEKTDFPPTERKEWIFKPVSQTSGSEKKQARNLKLLKSGNILINYVYQNRDDLIVKSYLSIYKIPKLEIVEEYIFQKEEEDDDIIYYIEPVSQTQEGNIFMISDALYMFKGESISEGPNIEGEKIDDLHLNTEQGTFYYSSDVDGKNPVYKKMKSFNCHNLLEVKKGLFLYTNLACNSMFKLDLSKTTITKKIFYEHPLKHNEGVRSCGINMLSISKYYPENLYFCVNICKRGGGEDLFSAEFYCFNIENFIKGNKEPLYMINVSKSQNIYGFCEYDKKYILLDSYANGIYIIDIELKQKVAVSVPKFFYKNSYSINIYSDRKSGHGTYYQNIHKLKDGQVLIMGNVVDIREQKGKEIGLRIYFTRTVYSGNYLISLLRDTSLNTYKICEKGQEENEEEGE